MEEGLSLYDLLKVLRKYWVVISLFLILGLIAGICYAAFGMEKEYRSETGVLVILSKTEVEKVEYNYNDSLIIINTVYQLVKQNIILSEVSFKTGYDTKELKEMIIVECPSSSLLLIIRCIAPTPESSQMIADTVADCLVRQCINNSSLEMIGDSLVKTSNADKGIYCGDNPFIYVIAFTLFGGLIGGISVIMKELILKKKKLKKEILLETPKIVENLQ